MTPHFGGRVWPLLRGRPTIGAAAASFERWMRALEARHLADLRIAEVARALRALSAAYVQRRTTLATGAALDGAGKRAAFALFYGPLHFLTVSRIIRRIGAAGRCARSSIWVAAPGAAGSAWAMAPGSDRRPSLLGLDRHPWAVAEAAWTYRTLGLRGRALAKGFLRAALPGRGDGVVAAYTDQRNRRGPATTVARSPPRFGSARRPYPGRWSPSPSVSRRGGGSGAAPSSAPAGAPTQWRFEPIFRNSSAAWIAPPGWIIAS